MDSRDATLQALTPTVMVLLIPIVRDHSVQFDVITCSDSS